MGHFEQYANAPQHTPRLGLDRIRLLMSYLGDPQERLSCIHIGGTNGKGSVAAYVDSILRHAGYKTGKFTSPNLLSVNERIAVDGTPISSEDLTRILEQIEPCAKQVETALGEAPSPFEIWTAAAFLYFLECGCRYVVLEVGMGGEFDATNCITKSLVTILTRIHLDHTEYLGKTPAEIAKTKCGIIKDNTETHTVISAPQLPEVAEVIRQAADAHGCQVLFVDPPAPKKHYGIYESVFFEGYGDIRLGLGGVHQIENAYIALTLARLLGIDIFDAQCGITFARHPARLELLREEPILLYDGAHNPSGVEVLLRSLERYYPNRPRTYLFACMKDKDYPAILRRLARAGDRFVFTTIPNNPRAATCEELLAAAEQLGISATAYPTLEEAIRESVMTYRVNVILGSLYLYAELPESYRSL